MQIAIAMATTFFGASRSAPTKIMSFAIRYDHDNIFLGLLLLTAGQPASPPPSHLAVVNGQKFNHNNSRDNLLIAGIYLGNIDRGRAAIARELHANYTHIQITEL